ncbi:hypothetical protein [Saccharothrix sp. 6-C]|uniref:hypothetical protein n=1 Tax=Saccharothrix sp. 6-C TaxID=2781735 RepID=UPI002E2AA740|nr:hypothetical protein [Saccharothrix sp. 6-C]
MPELTGHHAVGTAELHLIDRRPDPWQPARDREVMAPSHTPRTARAAHARRG